MRSIVFAVLATCSFITYLDASQSRSSNTNNQPKNIKGATGYHLNANPPNNAYCKKNCPQSGGKFEVDASVYYFQSKLGGNEQFIIDASNNTLLKGILPISGGLESIELDPGWGFSVGAGYTMCPCLDYWKFHLGYQRLTTSGRQISSVNNPQSLIPFANNMILSESLLTSENSIFTFCLEAKADNRFRYNAFDISLARNCFLTARLILTPVTSIRAAFIDYKQEVSFTGGTPLETLAGLDTQIVQVTDNNDFWGVGPSLAIDANWYLLKNLSLISKLGTTFFYGGLDVHHKEQLIDQNGNVSAIGNVKLRNHKFQYVPSILLDLGLTYEKDFSKGCRFEASLAYSTEYFWHYCQIMRFSGIYSGVYLPFSEDLAIQSGKLSFALIF